MKHIGQKFSSSRKKRDFEHVSLLTSLGCLVFAAELVCVHWQGLSVTGGRTSDDICSRLVTAAAFTHRGVVPAPITPLGASSARYTHCPTSVSALLFSFLVFDLKSITYQLTRIMERIIASVASHRGILEQGRGRVPGLSEGQEAGSILGLLGLARSAWAHLTWGSWTGIVLRSVLTPLCVTLALTDQTVTASTSCFLSVLTPHLGGPAYLTPLHHRPCSADWPSATRSPEHQVEQALRQMPPGSPQPLRAQAVSPGGPAASLSSGSVRDPECPARALALSLQLCSRAFLSLPSAIPKTPAS